MKKTFLMVSFGLLVASFSVQAATQPFCLATDGKGGKGYVKTDLDDMNSKIKDTATDPCVAKRYTKLAEKVNGLLKNCESVRNAVKSYCSTGKATGYDVKTLVHKGKAYKDSLILANVSDKEETCTSVSDPKEANANKPGTNWFFGKEECGSVNLTL